MKGTKFKNSSQFFAYTGDVTTVGRIRKAVKGFFGALMKEGSQM